MTSRKISYIKAVNEALNQTMAADSKVLFYGLGATDPKRIFGSSDNLVESFGESRVFDMPTSENAMTGIGIGAALQGFKVVMTHQRLDFFLLAMDQLVNSAAKWHYMFGGQDSVPITIRLILGRGWGQGPTHSQSLQAWFAHIPGLKVVMPATAFDAKGLLIESINDPNPVVFMEHRWLHAQIGDVPEESYSLPLGKARLMNEGKDVTIVAMSYMSIEALHACRKLKEMGVHCDLIDLRSIAPMDWPTIFSSIEKTGRLLVLDTAQSSFSVASEIIARVTSERFSYLKTAPRKLATPDLPVPTSFGLSKEFYHDSFDIVETVFELLEEKPKTLATRPPNPTPHDVPGDWFKGPF